MSTHPATTRSIPCFLAAIAAVVLLASPAVANATNAIPPAELYRAQTIVTGQGEANRILGFASCLKTFSIKVSGMLRLAGDPRLDHTRPMLRTWSGLFLPR